MTREKMSRTIHILSGGGGVENKGKLRLTGAAGGLINGLFGGGGGMAVVPLLRRWYGTEEKRAFATCVAIILPFCLLSAAVFLLRGSFDLLQALPYLIGGAAGGWVGGRTMGRVPTVWLRWIFAAFLLYGGVRYLL